MAKRRYRRYRRRTGKWSSNIQEFDSTTNVTPSGPFFLETTLATNPAQVINGISQTYTVKNFDINFIIETDTSNQVYSLESLCVYIMFAPQGMNITTDYNTQHPEYILNYKFIGSPSNDSEGQQYQPIKVRTRMSRKLQTGDRVILFLKGIKEGSNSAPLSLRGLIRWWTKAN